MADPNRLSVKGEISEYAVQKSMNRSISEEAYFKTWLEMTFDLINI